MPFLTKLDDDDLTFPPADEALDDPNGLLAIGGDLSVERLLTAYRSGIFPWYSDIQPILWWSPDPRAVLFPKNLHQSRRLKQEFKNPWFDITFDNDFNGVIEACAAPRKEEDGTWILPEMIRAYQRLHATGFAHSVEVWHNNELVGGVYGVAIGQVFFAESMFHHKTNASKIALVGLCQWLTKWQYQLMDCQFLTPHLERLGVIEIKRADYLKRLKQWIDKKPSNFAWNAVESLSLKTLL